ncbi:hypothetical protein [Actinomadura fibrosa]|uniref:Uncharacterized protein n=1 Tax=Actinomadura fibrosa TaxID=111802 RepID=A0ABW2XBY1_9ACTN|nr:hypothetical protein [Actinomadura fibrosa]
MTEAPSGPPGTAVRCPVCCLPAGTGDACGDCGWMLRTPWSLGATDRADFESRLGAARLAVDLRAAARLGGDWRDRAALLRGVPDDAAWAAARDAVRVEHRPAGPVLADGLARLPHGEPLAVIEVTADGVTARLVDERAQAGEPVRSRRWTELLPMLSADPGEREFQLAGGTRGMDRSAVEPELAAALATWAAPLPPARAAICRLPGLPLPELAAGLLADETAAEPGDLAAQLDEVAAVLPIRTGYGLLVAHIGPAPEQVTPALSEMLAAGSHRGDAATLTVYRAPGTSPPTTLAVCTVESPPRLVAAWRATLPTGPVAVRAELDGPARVRLTGPTGLAPEPRELDGILDGLPTWFRPPPPRLELVCLLELNGPAAAVAGRRELLDGLLGVLAEETGDRVETAVIGYADHYVRGRTNLDVVHGTGLKPPADTRTALARLPAPVEPYDRAAAPLEDALALLAAQDPSSTAPRILLVVAGRHPHPVGTDRGGRGPTACPGHIDASAALARAPAGHRVAVLDTVPDGEPAAIWRALGEHGLLGLADTTPRNLAVVLGLLPASPIPFSVPLAHPL